MKRDYLTSLKEAGESVVDFGTYGIFRKGNLEVSLDNAGFGTVRVDGTLKKLFYLPIEKSVLSVL